MSLQSFKSSESRSLRKVMLWALLIALVALVGFRIYQSMGRASKAKVPPAKVMQLKATELIAVQPSTFEQTLPLSGALTPYTQATVSARASGEVQSVKVREGQVVSKGQVLAVLVGTTYQAQYQQAVANLESAKSALELAKKDYDNNRQLVQEGFISTMALQKLEVSLANANSQLRNAQEALVIAKRALSEVTIVAPVSGAIATSKINAGDTVAIGSPLFSIVNTDQFELVAPISAEQIGSLSAGQTVQLSSIGVAQPFQGRVDRINPEAQNGSRSYSVYVAVDNPTGQLKSGMFAQGQIVLTARTGVLTVPATAIRHVDNRNFVYVVRDGKMTEQDVNLGARASDAIDAAVEITSGLNAGDQVVRLDLGVLKSGVDVVILSDKGTDAPPAPAVSP
ncbi:efflux RND transporter periplasmic adaptor subunit [Hydromonas duriensis]|uniref:RND family efflux transporter MFP subunit n=1 Tax=Hydromonas duriensis TaxID=1527608 RepID=A0A4R6Y7V2_9BURK|nr:efflux RND transporter periplasmic adaptor subunit [Hydromonas duriensis]TDR31433.1 RND family efflux transporter MFP subunit [Hydromonas duriensis]